MGEIISRNIIEDEEDYFNKEYIGSSSYKPHMEDELLKKAVYGDTFGEGKKSPALIIGSLMHDIIHKNSLKPLEPYSIGTKKVSYIGDIEDHIIGSNDYDFLHTILDCMPINKEKIKEDSIHYEEEVGRHVIYDIKNTKIKLRYKPDLFYVLKDDEKIGYLVDWKSYGNRAFSKNTYRNQSEIYSYNLLKEFPLDKIICIHVVFNKTTKKVVVESSGEYTSDNDHIVERNLLKIDRILRDKPYNELLVEKKHFYKYLTETRRASMDKKNIHVFTDAELEAFEC